ncbi:MAG: GGDEF domain-containing protein [Syntrophomonadaceae bacterium]|jgi:diguanylate cyclase (GGDEF)-like protein
MNILIADDDALFLKILRDNLVEWGHEVIVAHDGNEAWAILESDNRPNLAFLDWMMPGIDGIEICKRLRNLDSPSYIWAVLLTAKTKKEDLKKGLEAGADEYLVKPICFDELKLRLKIWQRVIEMQQKILSLASTDYLTGLLNRWSFWERLDKEIKRCNRNREHLGLIVMDLDYFKIINDFYGHQVGDKCLQETASILLKTCRIYDCCGRYGGDEFIIYLPGADMINTFQIAERIRVNLESRKIMDTANAGTVTASFGVTTMEPDHPLSLEKLIKEADDALYCAKLQGRNRVVVYAKNQDK